MEMSNKTHSNNNQQKKRVVIKSGGGGGIGGVLLFGGALATAALASAFVFKRKGTSSARDSRGQPPEIKKQSEKEDGMRIVSVDDPSLHAQQHQSEDVTENFETKNDSCLINIAQAQSLSQDELPPDVENSAEISEEADVENVDARDEIPCLETLRIPETDVISDDTIIIKKDLQLDQKSLIDLSSSINEEKVQSNGEDSSEIVVASNEENVVRSLTSSSEIPEVDDEYAVVIDQSTEESKDAVYKQSTEVENEYAVDVQSIEVENKDAVVIKDAEEENTDAVEIKDMLSSLEEYKNAVVIKEIQVTEENENNSKPKVNNVEEESGVEVVSDSMEAHQNENMKVDTEETRLEKDSYGDKEIEETAQKHVQTPHNLEFQELISSQDIPDKGCDLDAVSQLKDIEHDADDGNCELENNHHHDAEETIEEDGDSYKTVDAGKDDLLMEKGEDVISCDEDETGSSEPHSSEHSGDSSTESNSEALWPAENLQELSTVEPQQAKIFSDREVEGKFLEDKPVKETEFHQSKAEEFKADQQRYEKLLVQMEKTKDQPIISSSKRRIVIAILLILSSVSGSLIFGLSLVKLCFVAFLTVFLSEMNAY